MPGIDAVLERLVSEPGFRDQLKSDPRTALAGYTLSADDLDLLATQLTDDAGEGGAAEGRVTKAGLAGLFGSLFAGGGGGGASQIVQGIEVASDSIDTDGDDDGISDGTEAFQKTLAEMAPEIEGALGGSSEGAGDLPVPDDLDLGIELIDGPDDGPDDGTPAPPLNVDPDAFENVGSLPDGESDGDD